MPGIRVHHPTLRGGTYVVEGGRPYPQPSPCPRCPVDFTGTPRTHYHKAHHIDLDGEGYAIVSEGVLEELRGLGMAGLSIENEVKAPPPLVIGAGGAFLNGQDPETVGYYLERNGDG